MNEFYLKAVYATEKIFTDSPLPERELRSLYAFSDERIVFQLVFAADTDRFFRNTFKCDLVIEGDLRDEVSLYTVEQVPVRLPVYMENRDPDYLRVTPGLYPDPLIPRKNHEKLIFVKDEARSIFVKLENKQGLAPGKHRLVFSVSYDGEVLCGTEVELCIIDEKAGELPIHHTEWFYADCLAQYYNVPVWSERHWNIIENFINKAVEFKVNTLLTPVFTPPLDTAVGGERLTTQLVGVTLREGKYSFDFGRLDRWVQTALKCGIKYFEISHFFTQWGAEHAPKIMANADGIEKKLFGWETDASGEEYAEFLHAFIPELINFFKSVGVDKNCLYHISDEPRLEHLENYSKARNAVSELLKGCTVIDALSNYEFYRNGVVDKPVPSSSHIDEFLEHNVPGLWVYYCCSQYENVSNRFMSMPGRRTRIIGAQMYKYGIEGFLHWGFNFYNTRYSVRPVDPYLETSGEYFTPAGDCFLVYPSSDGHAYSSLHCEQFVMGLSDLCALYKCEEKFGREKTLSLLEDAECELTFTSYPKHDGYMDRVREKIYKLFEE